MLVYTHTHTHTSCLCLHNWFQACNATSQPNFLFIVPSCSLCKPIGILGINCDVCFQLWKDVIVVIGGHRTICRAIILATSIPRYKALNHISIMRTLTNATKTYACVCDYDLYHLLYNKEVIIGTRVEQQIKCK